MILVDTNVWSELTKAPWHQPVADWLAAHDEDLWLSVIVIAEFRMGIEKLPAGKRRAWLDTWCEGLLLEYGDRVLNFDAQSAPLFARLVIQRILEKQETKLHDLQIAAQGLAYGATVATRNVKDFAWTGVTVVNPWGE